MITLSVNEFENLDVVADEEVHIVRMGRYFIPMDHAIRWLELKTSPSHGDIVVIAMRNHHGVDRYQAQIVNYQDDRVLI